MAASNATVLRSGEALASATLAALHEKRKSPARSGLFLDWDKLFLGGMLDPVRPMLKLLHVLLRAGAGSFWLGSSGLHRRRMFDGDPGIGASLRKPLAMSNLGDALSLALYCQLLVMPARGDHSVMVLLRHALAVSFHGQAMTSGFTGDLFSLPEADMFLGRLVGLDLLALAGRLRLSSLRPRGQGL